MKLIIGLGNPESRYDGTRHNVGFFVVDKLAQQQNVSFKHNVKFKADIAEFTLEGEKVLLAKPTTYYNLVGESVQAIAQFYKVAPSDILAIHDELAIPFGTIRARAGGGDAGNNGVKSLTQHLGPDTMRLRIGIWNDLRDRMDDADFVLGKFSASERVALEEISDATLTLVQTFLAGQLAPHTLRVEV